MKERNSMERVLSTIEKDKEGLQTRLLTFPTTLMNCKKQNAILLEQNTILRSEVTSLNQLIQKNKETLDASKEEVEKYIESKKNRKRSLI